MHFERDGLLLYGFTEPSTRIRLSFSKGLSRFLIFVAAISGCVGLLLTTVGEYANREYVLAPAIIVSLTIPLVIMFVLGRFARMHGRLYEGGLRRFFVTENDFSYQLMFADASATWWISTPEVAEKIDSFFAHPEVIAADRVIRAAAAWGFGGLIKVYLARQVIIDHLKRLDDERPGDYWRSVHVTLNQELEDEYAALCRLRADMAMPPTDTTHLAVTHGQNR